MTGDFAAAALGAAALVLLLLALIVLYASTLPVATWRTLVLVSLTCAAPGPLAWLLLAPALSVDLRSVMMPSLAALGAVCCFLVTLVSRSSGAPLWRSVSYSAVWGVVVYVPIAVRTFEPFGAGAPLGLSPIDHGGALVMSVAVGASMLAVLVVERRSLIRGARKVVPVPVGITALVLAVLAWLVWLVGAEFAFDDVVALILANGVVSAIFGALGWFIVQLINHGAIKLKSLAGGLISGLIAVTAGAPLFTPVSAAVAGFIAGAVACAFTVRKGSPLGNQLRFLVNTHLIGGSIGVVSLGVLATGSGFLFTGQTFIFEQQFLSVLASAAFAFVVSSLVWWLLGLIGRRSESAEPRVLAKN
ncbi:ammonium transporter [Salinibacterium sp. UTAS2018]|uniref:ammonium transporter n=1 Tax=Salinibacterium sp. UTAS2018 TaxID=2508880 RepID=UPI00100954BB|nr:ammonium transporter [Salinibacterium sp. UTAS2018]QAV69525.1 ammonium transporter [Salinibacterium sp. UTAS2018]